MTIGGVAIFWLSVWVVYLLWRVYVLKLAVRMSHDFHSRMFTMAVRRPPQVEPLPVREDDGVLNSETIE